MNRPKVVRKDELQGVATPTPGVTRYEAFADENTGVVHREGNAGADPTTGVIVRFGQGEVTVNLDGPEA